MATIIENIGKALQEQAIPAARKLQTLVSEVLALLGDKAEEMAREFNKPLLPVARVKGSTDRAENHMYSPVSTALGDETVAQVKRRLSGKTAAFDSVELLFVSDADYKLQGVVSLSKLLAATPKMAIHELMISHITSVTLADP